MLIVQSDDKMAKFTRNILKSSFDMKDIDLVDVTLEIKISKISIGLIMS